MRAFTYDAYIRCFVGSCRRLYSAVPEIATSPFFCAVLLMILFSCSFALRQQDAPNSALIDAATSMSYAFQPPMRFIDCRAANSCAMRRDEMIRHAITRITSLPRYLPSAMLLRRQSPYAPALSRRARVQRREICCLIRIDDTRRQASAHARQRVVTTAAPCCV